MLRLGLFGRREELSNGFREPSFGTLEMGAFPALALEGAEVPPDSEGEVATAPPPEKETAGGDIVVDAV